MMSQYTELVLALRRRDAKSYIVEPQIIRPGAETPVDPDVGYVTFDFDTLRGLVNDMDAYGRVLTASFFANAQVTSAFNEARSIADGSMVPLRVRLFIGSDVPELHLLRWEALHDPRDDSLLATGARILLSRYIRSPDARRVRLRPRSDLNALVTIANPAQLEAYAPEGSRLQQIDVALELEIARQGLGAIPVTARTEPGESSLVKLSHSLSEGFDILYLVCHGALIDGQPRLYLEDEQGKIYVAHGRELAWELGKLAQPPLLVILASCQSAGSGTTGGLATVGPLLAQAGIPAVVAMQGKITVETCQRFMSALFTTLRTDGQIDRAVSVARGEVKDRHDVWMPVLFSRLRSTGIWDTSGQEAFERWPVLLGKIEEGRCTPIIGTGLIEFLLGSPREVAQRWADTYRFPMAPHDRANMPQVAQYLSIQQDAEFPRMELENHLKDEMRQRYGPQLPDGPLTQLITAVWQLRRQHDEIEPHHVLAQLPLPVYITTNPDNLLAEALREVGKDPQVVYCRWNERADWPATIYDTEPTYQPTPARPVVYHLFGHLDVPESVVLTEDDYFEYLIGVTKLMATRNAGSKDGMGPSNDIPSAVSRAWSDHALLFLGFQMDDWNFRVLFKSIMNEEGRNRSKRRKVHVAVQLDPEEGLSLDPQRARRYLQDYYFKDDAITIYWGSHDKFIQQLWHEWQARKKK